MRDGRYQSESRHRNTFSSVHALKYRCRRQYRRCCRRTDSWFARSTDVPPTWSRLTIGPLVIRAGLKRTVGALRVVFPASVVNLTVHGVGTPPRELDPGEDIAWISIEQLEQVLDAAVGRPDVRITFDDGNCSDVEIALPRLLERGLTAEFFVP